jgi:hypothetical protein
VTDNKSTFDFATLSCGSWAYHRSKPVFKEYYRTPRYGKIVLGNNALSLLLLEYAGQQQWAHRIDFHYDALDCIVLSDGEIGSVCISAIQAPKIYKSDQASNREPALGSPLRKFLPKQQAVKFRVTGLDTEHGVIAGTCFVYRVALPDACRLVQIRQFLNNCSAGPSVVLRWVSVMKPALSFFQEFINLQYSIGLQMDESRTLLPYFIRFQLLKLAYAGKLAPNIIQELLPHVHELRNRVGRFACHEAIRTLYRNLPVPGPHIPEEELDVQSLSDRLFEYAKSYNQKGSVFDSLKKHPQLKLIYRLRVTPTGLYLEGPEPEVTNRVVRVFEDHIESFVRVVFSDEDGQRIDFERNTNFDDIFQRRFKGLLSNGVTIGGKPFDFLGFSASSLKASTAWFMSPITNCKAPQLFGRTIYAHRVIEELGDFSLIRSPARCAARIGQAFTDTSAWFELKPGAVAWKKDVIDKHTGRVFSDGCGTISEELVEQIWDQYTRLELRVKPVVFQIRYKGLLISPLSVK